MDEDFVKVHRLSFSINSERSVGRYARVSGSHVRKQSAHLLRCGRKRLCCFSSMEHVVRFCWKSYCHQGEAGSLRVQSG